MKPITHATITRLAIQHCKGKISDRICRHTHEIVQGSIDEDESPWTGFSRLRNWHFYRSNSDLPEKVIFFKTTSEDILSDRIETLEKADRSNRKFFNYLGRVIHHIQDMSTPSHVIPIYHGPKVPFLFKKTYDYFESFMEQHDCRISLDEVPGEINIGSLDKYSDFKKIYESSADDMLQNVLKINGESNGLYFKYWKPYGKKGSEQQKVKGFGLYGKDHDDFINPDEEIIDSLFDIQDKITKHAILSTCKAVLLADRILEDKALQKD